MLEVAVDIEVEEAAAAFVTHQRTVSKLVVEVEGLAPVADDEPVPVDVEKKDQKMLRSQLQQVSFCSPGCLQVSEESKATVLEMG